jgi:prepilin-type N-terminal cleavage/methylation domain-containing protein
MFKRGARERHEKRGFTLVELMVVVSVIAILGSLLLGAIMEMRKQAKVRQCQSLLQSLVGSIETMKTDYSYSRPLGVDKDGIVLPIPDLDKIDIGKELNPRSPFWKPAPNVATEILLNKRQKTYYEVHSGQVMANNFVDPFGNEIRYRAEQIDIDVDENGFLEHYVEESLESAGPNGAFNDEDDIVQKFPRRAFLGEDKP